MKEISTFI